MTEVKRWDYTYGGLEVAIDGDYVLYTDHTAALEAVKAELDRQHTLHDNLNHKYEGVCAKLELAEERVEAVKETKPPERCACNFGTHCIYRNNGNECPRVKRLAAFVTPPALEADRLADKIEDMIEEFGDDPKAALDCISEWISLCRHSPTPSLEANQHAYFADLEAAYIRGANWWSENQDFGELLMKAAYDYADKQTALIPILESALVPALEANQQEMYEGRLMRVVDPLKTGYWRFHEYEANQQEAAEAAYREGWSDRISYRATDPEASVEDGWSFSEARAALPDNPKGDA